VLTDLQIPAIETCFIASFSPSLTAHKSWNKTLPSLSEYSRTQAGMYINGDNNPNS